MLDRKVLDQFEMQADVWKKRAADGIEKYRKKDAKLTVTNANGEPLKGVKIRINQKSHEFRFGANVFMLDEMESDEKNEKYKKYFAELFNMATLPFYWNANEPEQGKLRYDKDSENFYRRPPVDLCLEFCEKHGIEPREHGLAYAHFFPKWIRGMSIDEVKKLLEKRYSEISERYADKIPTIEVVNEMTHRTCVTPFYDDPEFIVWCFKLAEKYFPKNQLVINEGLGPMWDDKCRTSDKYYAYTEVSLLKGARIDAIGMQYHLFHRCEDLYNKTRQTLDPQRLYQYMDLYSRLGKPLQVTEITVPSYSWEAEDEEIQAQIIEYLYTIWFSHPNVEQIIYWNLVDGYAHVANRECLGDMTQGENYYHGGLLRFDLSPKPAYLKIKELLKERWHTEEELVTDENGNAEFRGFFGDYDALIIADQNTVLKKLTLSKKSDAQFTITV